MKSTGKRPPSSDIAHACELAQSSSLGYPKEWQDQGRFSNRHLNPGTDQPQETDGLDPLEGEDG